jgi:hypothetical protein
VGWAHRRPLHCDHFLIYCVSPPFLWKFHSFHFSYPHINQEWAQLEDPFLVSWDAVFKFYPGSFFFPWNSQIQYFSEGYRSINSIRAVRNRHSSLATEVTVLNSLETAGGRRSILLTVSSSTRLKSDRAESYIDFNEFWKQLHSHTGTFYKITVVMEDSVMTPW